MSTNSRIKQKKRILFVAAEFPPHKTIGRLRTLKFCLHLQNLGWECFVLTLPDAPSPAFDPLTLFEIPEGVKVFRAKPWQPEERVVNTIKRFISRKQVGHPEADSDNSNGDVFLRTNSTSNEKSSTYKDRIIAAKNLIDKIVYNHLLVPDDFIGWLIPALQVGKKVCRDYNIDLIFTTAPPFTSLLIGRLLKSATGLPWVADYRDLWTGDVLREWVPKWRQNVEIAMEKWTLSKANAIVAVSEPKTDVLKRRISKVSPEQFFSVTNGYDPEEYKDYEYVPNGNDKMRFVYTGRLFKNRRGYEFIEAAGKLFNKRPELKAKFQVEFYGGVSPEIRTRFDELLQRYDLAEQVKFFPDVQYHKAKALQTGADILLLIVDTGETTSGVIPGKLFEYVAARRPILCIAAAGATTEIIEKGNLGWVMHPGDVKSINYILEKILSQPNCRNFRPNKKYLSQFDRHKLTLRLEQILSTMLHKKDIVDCKDISKKGA